MEGLVSEYTDIIECSEGVNLTSSLFLLSSDYSIEEDLKIFIINESDYNIILLSEEY